ncbi:hypothetical protein WI96_27550 [Burkholderia vietnamiensis]|uniref:hypothetical protein n=1 Tax=Burkholderia TaxID=32008 RepID=UPI0007551AA1|nr:MULTISPECIES: hypothetical protein [Burkholderia]KVE59877.1 hypothetical protein WI96_27550 [Burkholderia vietnamiensis]QMI43977.1 hypothetical protein MBR110_00290 [Burkholderia sp. MBR-1]
MTKLRPVLFLAITATGTSVCMSVLAGWQRGGWLSERLVWIATGVVLVAGAHLLPALCRSVPPAIRLVGGLLWWACMAATAYGHGVFFLFAQQHAAAVRQASVPVVSVPVHRALPVVMGERADVVASLATANARRCVGNCATLQIRRTSLTARLDALDAEAAQVRRYQAIEDRNVAHRDSARDDPVTTRLAAVIGSTQAKLDLLAGLMFATVLECVACLLWWLALVPREHKPRIADRRKATPPVTATPLVTKPAPTYVPEPESEVTKLKRDIEAGIVKPTVVNIRQHLGCSQAKAAALRKQVIQLS